MDGEKLYSSNHQNDRKLSISNQQFHTPGSMRQGEVRNPSHHSKMNTSQILTENEVSQYQNEHISKISKISQSQISSSHQILEQISSKKQLTVLEIEDEELIQIENMPYMRIIRENIHIQVFYIDLNIW